MSKGRDGRQDFAGRRATVMTTDRLREHIRSAQAARRTHQPLQRPLFYRIHALVKAYRLGEEFLRALDAHVSGPRRAGLQPGVVKTKVSFEPPPFSLATEEEYRITTAIIEKVNNPYLPFANAPDEILVCSALYRRNPSLGPEELTRHHFETLLLREWNRMMEDDGSNFGAESTTD